MILAPSKTLDMSRTLPPHLAVTAPQFLNEATQLATVINASNDLARLMHVSPSIATRVKAMYEEWGSRKAPAIMTYVGDVYKGFHANTLSAQDLIWANEHLFIMSGLYGVVRPLDEISPYRLEMKAKVKVDDASNLYEFWSDKLARYVDRYADGLICNLASDEYARPVTKHTRSRIITPVFVDNRPDGTIGTVPIYSKMMRGVLARWIIDHRVDSPTSLAVFEAQGYTYDKARSTEDAPVFYRLVPAPIIF